MARFVQHTIDNVYLNLLLAISPMWSNTLVPQSITVMASYRLKVLCAAEQVN